jgi:hypothetical protein
VNLLLPEVHVGQGHTAEPELPLAADGVLRYVWHGRFGDMLVEVRDDQVFVNGKAVEPAATAMPSQSEAGVGT